MEDNIKKDDIFNGQGTTVSITLEDDSVIDCVVLGIFEADGREYIAVLPESNEDEEEGMVYLYRYSETADGDPILENIETDEEYEIVSDAFDEMLDEEEFAEMMEDIDDEDIIE